MGPVKPGAKALRQADKPNISRSMGPFSFFCFLSFQFERDMFKKCQGGSSADLWVPGQGGCHRERTM